MSELGFLCLEILLRLFRGSNLQRDALDDLQSETFDGYVLRWIVRHQADLTDTEVAKDLRAGAVVADVGSETELGVRLDGVVSLILQLVRLQLVDQADAAAFLQEIEDDAFLLGGNQLEGALELMPAIAARRLKHVAGQTRG